MFPESDAEVLQKALHREKLTKKRHHINVLKLLIVKLAILTFTQKLPNITIQQQSSCHQKSASQFDNVFGLMAL